MGCTAVLGSLCFLTFGINIVPLSFKCYGAQEEFLSRFLNPEDEDSRFL